MSHHHSRLYTTAATTTFAATALATLIVLVMSTLPASGQSNILPVPQEPSQGMLFHVSFDKDRQAEFSVGSNQPDKARFPYYNMTKDGGEFAAGVFGQALAGGRSLGYYDALGNINPARGTVTFFLKQKNRPYGFEPFILSTVDYYYWLRYLRTQINRNGTLVVSAANEIYRPRGIGAGTAQQPVTFKQDTWQHVAIAWDQSKGVRIYIDGQLKAQSWGEGWTWTSQGVDPDSFWLQPSADVQYDEMYVFDRPLTESQVKALATTNTPPSQSELPDLAFDDAWKANRLRELSWEAADDHQLKARLDVEGLGSNAVSQVTPLQARAVMGECNVVINGKLGDGWPSMYGYNFNKGNGLHVEVAAPFDLVNIEGYFQGQIYGKKTLVPTENDQPLGNINSVSYMTRWRLDHTQPAGWMSFFKGQWEELGESRDRESVTMSRITELGFFKTGTYELKESHASRSYLGPASVTLGREMLGVEYDGRFGAGDRVAFTLSGKQPVNAGGQSVSGLYYHHLLIPARKADWSLQGLRLGLQLQGDLVANALRVELRDPLLPSRRLMAIDYAIDDAQTENQSNVKWLDVTLDTVDRIVPAGRPVWVTLVFKNDVNLLWNVAERSSFIDVFSDEPSAAIDSHIAFDLPLILARFGDLSSPRPWGSQQEPEKTLPDMYPLAGEMFLPLTQLFGYAPDHSTLNALWLWTHKFTVNTAKVEPLPVAGNPDAPKWALLQRELFRANRSVFEWWIDHRQAPTGEFGDDWNDDTDFVADYPKYILAMDPDHKLLDSLRMVADGVYRFNRLTDGINTGPHDPLHAYEEGVNVQPGLALVDDGNPTQMARMMESARTVEERLTALDVHGRRRFISNHYGAKEVRDQSPNNIESLQNSLMAHPAIMLAYSTRNPRATKFVLDYADGWLGYFNDAVAAGEKRIPSATKLDGSIVRWDRRVRGFGVSGLFVAANELEPDPVRAAADQYWTMGHGGAAFRTGDAMAALQMVNYDDFKPQLVAWAKQADLTKPYIDRFGHVARQHYMGYEVTGDESYAYRSLEASLRNIRHLKDGYTIGEPQNDRIWPPDLVTAMMMFGEVPDERNQLWPRHYISYSGFTDFTAWVREKSNTHLKVWLYSFADHAESGTIRFWRTPLGTYRVRMGPADEKGNLTSASLDQTQELHRYAGVPVTFPPGKLMVMEVDLVEKSDDDFWQRADPAIGREDVTRQPDGSLQVKVSNIGNLPAKDVLVQVMDQSGQVLAQQVVTNIDAPLDMHPRSVTLTFAGLKSSVPLTIMLNADKRVVELNTFNNQTLAN